MDEAVEKLGSELASNSIMLCGPGAALMCYPIDHGEILNVAIIDFTVQEWNQEKWIVPANYADMAKKVEGWGKPAQAMCEVCQRTTSSETYSASSLGDMLTAFQT